LTGRRARSGTAHSAQLKKHPTSRRLATLLATLPATAQQLETKTIDDTLELQRDRPITGHARVPAPVTGTG
jgi:hypothetical protein